MTAGVSEETHRLQPVGLDRIAAACRGGSRQSHPYFPANSAGRMPVLKPLLPLFLLSAAISPLFAQTYGKITGAITDASGAVV